MSEQQELNIELKPCPIGMAFPTSALAHNCAVKRGLMNCWVECSCGADGPTGNSFTDAALLWNTRTADPRIQDWAQRIAKQSEIATRAGFPVIGVKLRTIVAEMEKSTQ